MKFSKLAAMGLAALLTVAAQAVVAAPEVRHEDSRHPKAPMKLGRDALEALPMESHASADSVSFAEGASRRRAHWVLHDDEHGMGEGHSHAVIADSVFTSKAFKPDTDDDFRVTSVPEPETYALMLAGLGVLIFVVRRRRV